MPSPVGVVVHHGQLPRMVGEEDGRPGGDGDVVVERNGAGRAKQEGHP